MATTFEGVLPSGVAIGLTSLTGADQGMITKQKNLSDNTAYFEMLAGRITHLGDKTNVNKNDVLRMLTNDRKDALVMLRQFSLEFQESFDFMYTWPIDKTTVVKHMEPYSVKFNDKDFKRIPYAWVADELARLAAAGTPFDGGPFTFPELYSSYSAMLVANSEQHYAMPKSGEVVQWELLTGEQEKKFGKLSKADVDSNTMLAMRVPKLVLGDADKTLTSWSPQRAVIMDTEGFRKEIRRVEGLIDTVLSISNEKDGREARIDLVTTPDFFFPSQAI
jgi:hypothetical protein